MLSGKHIVVGISGGIAAYKIPQLIRLLTKAGAEVRVCATRNALEFVGEVTLRTLSNAPVYSEVFAPENNRATEHISLHDWADLTIVAPATANIIGKMANGIADDALSTMLLAMNKPIVVAPSMNTNMFLHPAVRRNIDTIGLWDNVTVMGSPEGLLACGDSGAGRMAEPEDICLIADKLLEPQTLRGKRVLLTAGPTKEAIDPVRFISNHSSGKMAYALAHELEKRGAEVTIISGEVASEVRRRANDCTIIDVTSAEQMYAATTERFSQADIAILCAAVADYRPETAADRKIKRSGEELTLRLVENPDIAARLGQLKQAGQLLVGFALETDNAEQNAQDKLKKKNLDAIVLNSLADKGAGFNTDTNKVTILLANGEAMHYPLKDKTEVARDIAEVVTRLTGELNPLPL